MPLFQRELIIARRARQAVDGLIGENSKKDEIVTHLESLPTFILQNGLLQTVAFLQGKGGLEGDICNALNQFLFPPEGRSALLSYLTTDLHDSREYVRLQSLAIEYAVWMKRIAVAVYKNV